MREGKTQPLSAKLGDRALSTRTVPGLPSLPCVGAPQILSELARQLDTGQLYERDLPPLARALSDVLEAIERRTARPR